jgi:hypothetical protein
VSCRTRRGAIEVSIVIKRDLRLLLVLAALCISATATAGRGGGWVHGGGGGGGYGGGGYGGGGYGGVNHSSNWSSGYHGGSYGATWYHGGYYHGGYHGWYHGGYYHGGYYGCCGSVSVGFYFGPGFIYGYPFYPYYYAPYYANVYYPYVSGDSSEPTQYIEQGQAQAGGAEGYDQGGDTSQVPVWYYCGKPQGYYPYVRTCASGWQKVPARPPDS